MLNDAPKDDSVDSMDFAGSAMTILAKDKEEALAMFRDDPYTKAGVWDAEKVQIYAVCMVTAREMVLTVCSSKLRLGCRWRSRGLQDTGAVIVDSIQKSRWSLSSSP